MSSEKTKVVCGSKYFDTLRDACAIFFQAVRFAQKVSWGSGQVFYMAEIFEYDPNAMCYVKHL